MSIQTKNYQFTLFENEKRKIDNLHKLGEEELLKKRVLTQFSNINNLKKEATANRESINALIEQLKEDGREFVYEEKPSTGLRGQISLNQHQIHELCDILDHQRKMIEQLTDFVLEQ